MSRTEAGVPPCARFRRSLKQTTSYNPALSKSLPSQRPRSPSPPPLPARCIHPPRPTVALGRPIRPDSTRVQITTASCSIPARHVACRRRRACSRAPRRGARRRPSRSLHDGAQAAVDVGAAPAATWELAEPAPPQISPSSSGTGGLSLRQHSCRRGAVPPGGEPPGLPRATTRLRRQNTGFEDTATSAEDLHALCRSRG